jgi:adenylylsulfate reductase subunit B
MWTIKFRNGTLKRFKFPIRTTPEGSIDCYGGKDEADMANIEKIGFFNHKEQNGFREGDPSELICK